MKSVNFITNILFISLLKFSQQFEYPEVKRTENVIDNYFGTNVSDPYRWLEDLNSEATKFFVEEQNNLTNSYLEDIPKRDEMRENLKRLWNYTDTDPPIKAGDRYFFFSKKGGQNHSVYYYKDSYDGPAIVALDPNTFSPKNSTPASLSDGSVVPSNNGQIISYGISYGGVDWYHLHFKNISSGEILPDVLTELKLSNIMWTPDSEGIIYPRYDIIDHSANSENSGKKRQNIYYHKIGTNQSEDILIVEIPKEFTFLMAYDHLQMTSDNKYLLISPIASYPKHYVWYANIEDALKKGFQNGKLVIESLETSGDASYKFLTNLDSTLYFLTNKNAPNRKVVSIDLNKMGNSSESKEWTVVVPEDSNILEFATVVDKDVLVLAYNKDVKSTLELRNLENGTLIKNIPLENGFLTDFRVVPAHYKYKELHYKFESLVTPGKIFKINFENENLEPELVSENIIEGYNSADYKSSQVFYHSKDGTKVPMYILHKKDYVPEGSTPCFLYSYGGFGVILFKSFEPSYISFLQTFNGIVALPSIRGGGEYGRKWHDDGRRHKKQNSFDDFAAAAEYLIREKYTESSKIAINGASNGGLLIAASINQRPDLFGAAIAQAGVMDIIRFQLKTDLTHLNEEYGVPTNEKDFQTLIKYSPLHNVKFPENKTVQYPATLIITGEKDDRVLPYNSYKFTAELQYQIGRNKERQTNPLLLAVEPNIGHGFGRTTSDLIEDWTKIFSFISKSLSLNTTKQS